MSLGFVAENEKLVAKYYNTSELNSDILASMYRLRSLAC